jgi:protein-S-isoprenylcysteine O-methyltransferase Ste14
MDELNKKAWVGLGKFVVSLAAMVFLPAWTVNYWQGWVFLAAFCVPTALVGMYLMKHDPVLLERRLKGGPRFEKQGRQKTIQGLATIAFVVLSGFPGVDHRFGWSHVPWSVVALGNVLTVAGLVLIFFVFKANSFTSSTIAVHEGQSVVDTGPYAEVRHPMYAGALITLWGTPLALGSWWGLLMAVPITLVVAWRLLEEERFLVKSLPGYAEYREKVKHRLVPGVW